MIDLYERLGVPFGSSEDAIKLAVAKTRTSDGKLADRAAEILMVPQRRRAYDRLWISLTRIGEVRALAQLNEAPFGTRAEYAEFRFSSSAASKPDADKSTNRRSPGHTFLVQALIGGVAPLALALSLGWFLRQSSPIQSSTSEQPSQTAIDSAAAAQAAAERQARNLLARSNEAAREAQKKLEASWQLPASKTNPLPLPTTLTMAPLVVTTELPPAVELKPHPLPETGAGKTLIKAGKDNWIQIKTSGEHHTLVKVERPDGQLVATRFIRAAEKLRIYLPLGTYVLKTTTGRQWYGDEDRFGPEASFSKPDDTFPLNKPGEYWEVELILQEGGNLSQSAISEAEFGAD